MSLDDDATQPPLRLSRLYIEELFGPGSTPIDIRFKVGERVTVLHGRNGSGKTITLGLIQAVFEGRFEQLYAYQFSRLDLEFADGSTLKISPASQSSEHRRPPASRKTRPPAGTRLAAQVSPPADLAEVEDALYYEVALGDQREQDTWAPQRTDLGREIREQIREGLIILPWLTPVSPTMWWDERAGRKLSDADVLTRYGASLASLLRGRVRSMVPPTQPVLAQLLKRLPRVKFIRADRLFVRDNTPDPEVLERFRRRSPESDLMVERLSKDIQTLVSHANRQYTLTATRLDSSFPQRLFESHKDLPSLEDLKERSKRLREQESHLASLGLIADKSDVLDETRLDEEQKKAFFLILKDREEKLRPFHSVASKAQRLLESLNRKLAPKRVRLNVETGYQILTAAGDDLPLHCLSSGEQHELVLLHELLFDVQPGSLILIDEPELSLHVTWQVDVIPDLLDIAKLSDLDIVLATHSPYIVRDHDDLMVRLGEPV